MIIPKTLTDSVNGSQQGFLPPYTSASVANTSTSTWTVFPAPNTAYPQLPNQNPFTATYLPGTPFMGSQQNIFPPHTSTSVAHPSTSPATVMPAPNATYPQNDISPLSTIHLVHHVWEINRTHSLCRRSVK